MRLALLASTASRLTTDLMALRQVDGIDITVISGSSEADFATVNAQVLSLAQAAQVVPFDAAIVTADIESRHRMIADASTLAPRVLVEIPITLSEAEAGPLLQSCAARHVMLTPALALRSLPVLRSLKETLDRGTIGDVVAVKVESRARRSMNPAEEGNWRILDRAADAIDLLFWLLDTEIAELHTEAGAGLFHRNTPSALDTALLSSRLTSGAYATVSVSLSLPPTYPTPEDLRLEITGLGGWLRVDAFRQAIDVYNGDSVQRVIWGSQRRPELLRTFIDALNGVAAMPSFEDALPAQRLALSLLNAPDPARERHL